VNAFEWTDAEVRKALTLPATGPDDAITFGRVSTDSRSVEPGDLFVALTGDRFDGHEFIPDALARGARGAVVSRLLPHGSSIPLYTVPDTLVALGALAGHRRRALSAPVVGITGSAGKTTTKELTRAALAGERRVHATKGNLNNRVGAPLTLLSTPPDAEVVVLELGTNEPGEIEALAAIARPDIGVVTTVGESHLEKLGSVEGVLQEKLDLLRGLAAGGRCLVGDEPDALVRESRRACPGVRVAGWSERADPDLRPVDAHSDAEGAYRFSWRGHGTTLALPGRHAVVDALLALVVAEMLGVSAASATRGVASIGGGSMRSEVRQLARLTLLVDCYNANPPSVRVALDVLEHRSASRRVAVLGTMLELGEASARLHRDVLRDALGRDLDLVVATGAFAEAARNEVSSDRVLVAPTWAEAYPGLRAWLADGDVVLLKASRGIGMEGLLPLLDRDFGPAAAGAR